MKKTLFLVLVSLLVVPSLASAKKLPYKHSVENFGADRTGTIQSGLGVGLVFHDPAFDFRLEGEYFVTHNISAGLNLDIITHDSTTFGFDFVGRYHLDFDNLPRLVPYVGAGLGAVINTVGSGGMDILIPAIGAKYEVIAGRLFLGPELGVHIVTDFSDTTWDVSLMIVQAIYRF